MKITSGRQWNDWRVTIDHQRHAPAKPSKVYPEELSRMLFQDRQSMQRDLPHTTKISRRFSSEWRSDPWCCDLDKNRTDHLPVLIPLFLGICFQGIWHILSMGKLRSDIPLKFVLCLRSPFLNIGIITPVCQSVWVLPNFYATWHTRVNQRIPSSVSAFNISGLISSLPAAFPDFIPLIAVATSATVKTSSSSTCVTLYLLRVDAFTRFKRSSKYSLHRERISFSSVGMFPAESLMEYVTLDFSPRKRRMVCQNTLFAEK